MPRFTVDYFELPVPDAGKSRDFFMRAFGWGAQDYGEGYVELREAGVLGGLNADPADRTAAPVVGIRTDDIVAAEAAVVAAGGTVTRPTYRYPGGRRFVFREPGGVELLVYQPD